MSEVPLYLEFEDLRGWKSRGRETTRAEDAQGTPTQSHISPSILVPGVRGSVRTRRARRLRATRSPAKVAGLYKPSPMTLRNSDFTNRHP